jgi:ATP-dependent RNA helicase DDX51/DBP6
MAKKAKIPSEVSNNADSSAKKRQRDAESPDAPSPSSTSPVSRPKKRKREKAESAATAPHKNENPEGLQSPEIDGQDNHSKSQTKKKSASSADRSSPTTDAKDAGTKKSKKRRSLSPVESSTGTSSLKAGSKKSRSKNLDFDEHDEHHSSTPKKKKRNTPKDAASPSSDEEDTNEKDHNRRSKNKEASDDTSTPSRKRKHQQTQGQKLEDDDPTAKHSKIMKKFEKSTKGKKTHEEDADQTKDSEKELDESTAVVAKGLEPLPQPQPAPEKGEKPTYSTMPNWITTPITKSPYEKKDDTLIDFGSLNLDKGIVSKLEKHGYKEATAVQATLIPLLIDRAHRHYGDLCVSASTGSGKTLSYVLPMDQSLEREPLARLRGLIVVPTRELVKQAREAFEACGSNLRIGTAVGNVALKDEQHKLIRWDQVYKPENYIANQQRAFTGSDWDNFDLLKYKDEVNRSSSSLSQYIQMPQPNVDVLITTPGRLVDHIRQTEGFSLRHLQWLVVDEADRLLNESFQEWVTVLMTELDKAKTVNLGGPIMDNIGHPLRSSSPKKVILSATLTNDITKLNSLRLDNPKLVAIGLKEADSTEVAKESEQFVLPSSLEEHYVPVDDGSEKPVHLMRLILQEINKTTWGSIATPAYKLETENKHESSDEDTSSDSDDTSSSGSDTSDSDSDSESDSSSDATSSSGSSSDSSSDESESEESEPESESDSSSEKTSVDESPVQPTKPSKVDTKSVLIFTKSTESAARLSLLLGLMNPSLKEKIGTIVKSNNSSSSRKTLKDYRAGKVKIIVATDRASRGIDLVDLGAVINYDIPTSITTYVHRIGRTARAGKTGHAWTLVEHREGLWFQKVIVKSQNVVRSGKVMKYTTSTKNTKAMRKEFSAALEKLEKAVKG